MFDTKYNLIILCTSFIVETTTISIFMKISLVSGAILATPLTLYQLLCFVTPGLTSGERRSLYWIIPGVTISFLGVFLAWVAERQNHKRDNAA